MAKSVDSINEKIRSGRVTVPTAEEMTRLVREAGPDEAAETVDVVTTGTFGAMCSSGAWLNFGHAEPPIKMIKVFLNGVEAYARVAAVDAYIGATQPSESEGIAYGGAHVIEDLVRGKSVVVHAVSCGTDCYPRKELVTEITIDDLNPTLMSNPRNSYQRCNAATNSGAAPISTYMGRLLPRYGNVTFSGAGEPAPPPERSRGADDRRGHEDTPRGRRWRLSTRRASRGMLVIIGDLLVASGELPEIVRAHVDRELIAKG